jgi:hypothetical protein
VKAAKSSAENFGWCVAVSSDASEGAAKTVEDRLGKARSAAVAAIRTCFFIRGLEMVRMTPEVSPDKGEKQLNIP